MNKHYISNIKEAKHSKKARFVKAEKSRFSSMIQCLRHDDRKRSDDSGL
jgi:hypothetical protein